MTTVTLELEDELVSLLHQSNLPAPQAARESLVLELYRQARISSGKAAQLLGLTGWAFAPYAARLGIPYFDMTEDEWATEHAERGNMTLGPVVSNSSAIIALDRIGQLPLLSGLFTQLCGKNEVRRRSRHALRSFVEKAVEALYRGYHLLIVDLFPPGPRDPHGIHAAIWGEFSHDAASLPPEEPLALAAYSAGSIKRAYVEPTAVGRPLADMPLFLEADAYVHVPLEATYRAAYRGVPRRWREVLD